MTPKDGILILDAERAVVVEATPFLAELVGCSREELLGKPIREVDFPGVGLQGETLLEKVRRDGYVRYDGLPLRTGEGDSVLVDLVGNSYLVDGRTVIQFNVCDVT